MKTNILLLSSLAALLLVACGDDKNTPDARTVAQPDADLTPDAPPGTPAAPKIGTQIDRMGRPAINTALNHFLDPTPATKETSKENYNNASDPATWKTTQLASAQDTVLAEFTGNLAVLDGLDSDGTTDRCGNQPFHMATGVPATAYGTLATALADDELYVDTRKGNCDFYLGVEGAALLQMAPNNCGGRTPTYDVIDISYTALISGDLGSVIAGTPSITDGVKGDDAPAANSTTFPFLGAPH